MRTSLLVIMTGLVLQLVACGSNSSGDGNNATMPADDQAGLGAYPALYRSMDLPALPGATITSSGRQTTSLRDGLAIRLTTTTGVAEARDYYRRELTARGWTEEVGPGRAAEAVMPNLPLARVSFLQGSLSYTATITASDGQTNIQINLLDP
jgi:hypothetical protein